MERRYLTAREVREHFPGVDMDTPNFGTGTDLSKAQSSKSAKSLGSKKKSIPKGRNAKGMRGLKAARKAGRKR